MGSSQTGFRIPTRTQRLDSRGSVNSHMCPLSDPAAVGASDGNWLKSFLIGLRKRRGHLRSRTFLRPLNPQQSSGTESAWKIHSETRLWRRTKVYLNGSDSGTHVGLPQIFRWYHCLQLVKYFLLVPLICCMAQTLGLKETKDRATIC